jgi:hypothetical protein
MDFCNTLHYLVGSVGPHLTTFVTFFHLTSAGLTIKKGLKMLKILTRSAY